MIKDIVEKIMNGDVRVASKLIRDIDDRVHGTRDILKALTQALDGRRCSATSIVFSPKWRRESGAPSSVRGRRDAEL